MKEQLDSILRDRRRFALGLFGLAGASAAACAPTGAATSPGDVSSAVQALTSANVIVAETIADLRATFATSAPCCAVLLGFHEPGDGGGGVFEWRATGYGPDDNGITVVPTCAPVPPATTCDPGAWVRLVDGPINALWFGLRRGTAADGALNRAALQAAIDAAASAPPGGTFTEASNARAFGHARVFVPRGHYVVFGTVRLGPNVVVSGEGMYATVLVNNDPARVTPWFKVAGGSSQGGGIEDLAMVFDRAELEPTFTFINVSSRNSTRFDGLLLSSKSNGTATAGVTTLGFLFDTITGTLVRDCRLQYCGIQVLGGGMSTTASFERVYVNGGYLPSSALATRCAELPPGEPCEPRMGLQVPAFLLEGFGHRILDCVCEYIGAGSSSTGEPVAAIEVRAGAGTISDCFFEGNGGWCVRLGTAFQSELLANARYDVHRCFFNGNYGGLGVQVGYARASSVAFCDFYSLRHYGGATAKSIEIVANAPVGATVGGDARFQSDAFTAWGNSFGRVTVRGDAYPLDEYPGLLMSELNDPSRLPFMTGRGRLADNASAARLPRAVLHTLAWPAGAPPATLAPGAAVTTVESVSGARASDIVTAALYYAPPPGLVVHAVVYAEGLVSITFVNHGAAAAAIPGNQVRLEIWRHA